MLTLLRNGGYIPMLFILMTGATGLIAAFYFALRAKKQTLGFIQTMVLATLFGTLAATCGDVGATLYGAEKVLDKDASNQTTLGPPKPSSSERDNLPNAIHIIVGGFAESTSPGILGFSFLALTQMLVAVGRRRLDEKETARA